MVVLQALALITKHHSLYIRSPSSLLAMEGGNRL